MKTGIVIGASLLVGLAAPSTATPPVTPTTPAAGVYWGVRIADPYRWLENESSPRVQAWIDAQNAYTESVLARITQGPSLVKRIRELSLTGPQQFAPTLAGGTLFYFREVPPQPQPVLMAQAWPNGKPRVLVDPNAGNGLTSIEDVWPSADGRFVAYDTQVGGSEQPTVHAVEVASGNRLADSLTPLAGIAVSPEALVWDQDDKGFVYVRFPLPHTVPDSELSFSASLYHHVIGTPAAADTLVFGRGLSRVAEYLLRESDDGSRAAAVVHFGDGSNNYVYARDNGTWQLVAAPRDGVPSWDDGTVIFDGSRLLAVATAGSPRGRVVELAPGGLHTVVPQGDWAMRAIAPVAGGFLVSEVWGPDWRVRQFDANGRYVRTVALPSSGIGIDSMTSTASSPIAIIEYSGWTMTPRWARYDAHSGAVGLMYALRPPADYSGVGMTRLDAKAPDGALIPVTVLFKRGMVRNGQAPAILTAYGAYGLTTSPNFLGSMLAWIERGGVFAVANIRGGGEFGEDWHQAGALLNERQRYIDLNAAAQALEASGWTSAQHLGITGGSAGGLLMGEALVSAPQLYRAVVSFVGIYDAVRDELTPNGFMNITEFGTVTKPDQFKAVLGYSPLQHVHDGTRYPAALLITGENDPRVAPWHSWKMAARLQAATASRWPVVVLTQRQAGHGVGASFSQRLSNRSAELIFLAGELGLR